MRNAAVTLVKALLIAAVLLALADFFEIPMVREASGVQRPPLPELQASLLLPEQGSQRQMLLRVKNPMDVPLMVCVRSSQYGIGSTGRGTASPHRCMNNMNFVVVLSRESYVFDTGISSDMDSKEVLSVVATVVVRSIAGPDTNTESRIEWTGTAEEARVLFDKLVLRSSSSPNL